MTDDLGPYGSLTLEASVSGIPDVLGGDEAGAYAFLVSLNDGTNEYINLKNSLLLNNFWMIG